MIKSKYFVLLVLISIFFTNCFNDNDDIPYNSTVEDINKFIWNGMNYFYLYKADVPNLANDRFSSEQEKTNFLKSFLTPTDFFETLKSQVDEFSFLVDDYIALEQAFDGVTKNNGMEFGLNLYSKDSHNVYGYVRYVLPETDAAAKGIKRGDIFNTINGIQITDKNFRQLLNLDTYTIGLAKFDGTTILPTGKSTLLNKTEYTENPVFIAKTIDVEGKKIGYVMYNSFTGNFDKQLNAAFGRLKSDGVTELVLDLRYNGGGSVESSIDLSSMITGQFIGKIFTTEEWNADRQQQLGSAPNFFDDRIRTNDAINSLNLTKVYILTTKSSASASELVINGLDPYITVKQVGTTTRGKFQASITLYDSSNFRRDKANPGHTYAVQPLVLKSINSVGYTDYFNGLDPEIKIEEDYANLGMLGDVNEPLLKAAIEDILGKKVSKKSNNTTRQPESIGDSNMFNPNYQRMYLNPKIKN